MKAVGIVRKVDDLGRIVIPKELRDINGWEPDTPLEVLATDKGIFVQSYKPEAEKQEILKQLDEVMKMASSETINSAIDRVKEFILKR